MAAILLKGQILKVLSRFAKDLDANSLKFSSLSQAFLSDLVLNEEVLSQLLELPVWIKLSRAVCNRVSIQIPWTHLSSQPIRISLDEVYVDMETCAELRPFTAGPAATSGDYGRTEMAVDGMLVTVNTVEIHFRAPSFHASIQVNRINIFSTTPDYEASQDLRMTRLKDESRDAVLVFKCVSWQTVRIEATSGDVSDGVNLSSIRLITSAGQARIALKKHLSTCELMASRLQIIMDDLLWVLTPSQLKAALSVVQELQALASTADAVVRTKKAARKLQSNQGTNRPRRSGSATSASAKISQYFEKIDILETSYHFHLTKLNLHICDEPRGRFPTPPKYEDAAILIEVERLKLDYYPYHIPSTARRHWLLYREPDPHYVIWQKDILGDYLHQIEKDIPDLQLNPLQYLMCTVLVFQVEDFRINNMTTIHSQKKKEKREIEKNFPLCCSLKKSLHLPKQCAAAHLEYIFHYYPQEMPFRAPPHVMQLFCNPIQATLDLPTLDWFTLICAEMGTTKESDLPLNFSDASIPEVVCRFEILLPKAICPVELPESAMRDHALHYGLQMQSGRVILTNTQTGRDRTLRDSLTTMHLETKNKNKNNNETKNNEKNIFSENQKNILNGGVTFPSNKDDPDIGLLLDHVTNLADSAHSVGPTHCPLPLSVWSLLLEPAWMEFIDLKNEKKRPVAFIEPFPVCLWVIPFEEVVHGGRAVFAFADVSTSTLKIQTTNDGYNVVLRSVDLALKVFDSVIVNCKDLFTAAKKQSQGEKKQSQGEKKQSPGEVLRKNQSEGAKNQSEGAVLVTAVASLSKVEFTFLLDQPDTSGSLSSDQMSEISQRPESADRPLAPPLGGSASINQPYTNPQGVEFQNGSASLKDDFSSFSDFTPRDLDNADTMSLRSVMSESSIAESGSVMGGDDLSAMLVGAINADDTIPGLLVDGKAELPVAGWVSRSPEATEKGVIRVLTAEISEIESVFVTWKGTLFTKLTCEDVQLKPPTDGLQNGNAELVENFVPSENLHNETFKQPKIAMRFQSEEASNASNASNDVSSSRSLLTLLCQNCHLECTTEASTRIASFFKTDLVGEPIPLLLTLRHFKLLVNDQNGQVGSSGVRVQNLTCTRGKDGVFCVESSETKGATQEEPAPSVGLSSTEAHERILYLKQKQSLIAQELQSLQTTFQRSDA